MNETLGPVRIDIEPKTKYEYQWKELNELVDVTKSAEYFGDEEEQKWLNSTVRRP